MMEKRNVLVCTVSVRTVFLADNMTEHLKVEVLDGKKRQKARNTAKLIN